MAYQPTCHPTPGSMLGLPGSPTELPGQGREDQKEVKELGANPLAASMSPGPPGLTGPPLDLLEQPSRASYIELCGLGGLMPSWEATRGAPLTGFGS